MATTYDYQLPFPMNQVWNTLPSAVHHTKKASNTGNPVPGGYRYTFSTGISLRTFGFTVFVDLHPLPQGTHMRVTTSMNFGLIDWGEGRDIANELHLHLTNLLQTHNNHSQGWQQNP
ncbi:hypothetical protein KIK06_08060 [Nocardiopsis sp. EMB25]|uniref:hypothetical protein n=1 Tax=Nocardiopsis TaxID=2013 RepID=UPI0003457050|nr:MULTISPECIES: hypothetical protein [Nocardiopsis]MCY9783843.1 hypothetical protein [Nocardiopsis sp. EMB25]